MFPGIFAHPFFLPLSGDVVQAFHPASWIFRNPMWGLVNVFVGRPGNVEVEAAILEDVGSYGRQIGRLADAVDVLLSTIDARVLAPEQVAAVALFKDQLRTVRAIKARTTGKTYSDLSGPPSRNNSG